MTTIDSRRTSQRTTQLVDSLEHINTIRRNLAGIDLRRTREPLRSTLHEARKTADLLLEYVVDGIHQDAAAMKQ